MLKKLRKMLSENAPLPAVPDGVRVYAIGDIHGRLDLLDVLLKAIVDDNKARGPADTRLLLLGDLVDRGPDSRGVIKRARQLAKMGATVLGGNHEDMFLLAFKKPSALRSFLRYGGKETLISYGIDAKTLRKAEVEELQALMEERVPAKHRRFLEGLENQVRIGDYAFVHAGIDPEVPLSEQRQSDLRWIREPFLSHRGQLEAMIVHGHTVTEDVTTKRHRIGIDTGAYDSGVLTALVLEGTARRTLSTRQNGDTIAVEMKEMEL